MKKVYKVGVGTGLAAGLVLFGAQSAQAQEGDAMFAPSHSHADRCNNITGPLMIATALAQNMCRASAVVMGIETEYTQPSIGPAEKLSEKKITNTEKYIAPLLLEGLVVVGVIAGGRTANRRVTVWQQEMQRQEHIGQIYDTLFIYESLDQDSFNAEMSKTSLLNPPNQD